VKWNGHRAAVSLTFDDGLPCQLSHALPALDEANLQGTFFLIPRMPEELSTAGFAAEKWRRASHMGHEIGSHSMTHPKASTLSPQGAYREARDSKVFLEREIGKPITSYCYPFTDAPDWYQAEVRKAGYRCARGGRVARVNKFIDPQQGCNLMNVPCFHIAEGTFHEDTIYGYLEEALKLGAWVVLMFHGVGPDLSQWDNVTGESFQALMLHLRTLQKKGLWVAPFGRIAEVLR
jgi:peptidoglycan/xylan/chitin deacetylase (PgdA/CDA1 family)